MSGRIWIAVAALVVAPTVVCVVLQLLHVGDYAISKGDVATIELRILHALRFEQLLGPYSRFKVSHPGPVFFYALAPVYALSGRAGGSMYVAAACINLAACGGIVRVAWSRLSGPVHRAALLVGVVGLLSVLVGAHSPLALATPWNPYVTIIPFALLLVLCAATDVSPRWWVVGVVGLHAFVAQTHAMYLLPATAALGLGLAWRWRRADVLLAIAVACVLWLPTAVDEIAGTHNLRAIAALQGNQRLGLSFTETVTSLADHLAFGSAVVLVALIVVLAWARVRLHGESSFRARMVLMAIVQLAAATLVLARLDAPRSYLTAWVWAVAFIAWLAVAWAWLPAEVGQRLRALPLAIATLAACIGGVHQLRVMTERMRKLAAGTPKRIADVERLVADYETLAPDGALLISRAPKQWHIFIAVALQLHKRNAPFAVEPKWHRMMGEGVSTIDDPEHVLTLVETDDGLVLTPEPSPEENARRSGNPPE